MTVDLLLLREEFDEESAPVANGRTLTIRLATVGRVYTVGHKGSKLMRERIAPGAFKEPIARPQGVLRYRHVGERDGDRDSLDDIYGVINRIWQTDDQVFADAEVFPGDVGDKVLRIAPAVRGASLSAMVRESRPTSDKHGKLVEITRLGPFNGVSLTPKPAYDDAAVLAVREQLPPDPMTEQHRREAVAAERAANVAARKMLARAL